MHREAREQCELFEAARARWKIPTLIVLAHVPARRDPGLLCVYFRVSV